MPLIKDYRTKQQKDACVKRLADYDKENRKKTEALMRDAGWSETKMAFELRAMGLLGDEEGFCK